MKFNWTREKRGALTILAILGAISIFSFQNFTTSDPNFISSFDGIESVVVGNLSVGGWACAYGELESVTVQIYAGNPTNGGVELFSVTANLPSEPEIAAACGTSGQYYRFLAPLTPAQIATYGGKQIYGTINHTSAQVPAGSLTQVIPEGAGSAENVNKAEGFNLIVDCSKNLGLNCSSAYTPPVLGGNPSYAYASSIIHKDGMYHQFFCSVGVGGWDSIRYNTSTDGVHWTTPVIKLVNTGAANQDFSACDPSVVFFNGYYYMFYGSAYLSPNGNSSATVIQVARSQTIDGEYRIYAQDGTWGATASNPPKRLITPYQDVQNTYGAGQPTVVVQNGTLYMWYTDDSYSTASYGPGAQDNIFMLTSNNPVEWNPCHYSGTQAECPHLTNTGEANVDVKYDTVNKKFVMFSLDQTGKQEVLNWRRSTDGLSWSGRMELKTLPNNPFSFFGQNPGVSGDQVGQLIAEPLLVTYMAPFLNELDTDKGRDLSGGKTSSLWNLYGAFLQSPP